MPTVDLTRYYWKTLAPMILKIIAPILILVVIFLIIRVILSHVVKNRTLRILLDGLLAFIFLAALVLIGGPATQAVLRTIKYVPPDYDIFSYPSSSSSKVPSSQSSSRTSSDRGYKEEDREKQNEKESQTSSSNSQEPDEEPFQNPNDFPYTTFEDWVDSVWLEKHPESTLKEEEYKEYSEVALEFWNKLKESQTSSSNSQEPDGEPFQNPNDFPYTMFKNWADSVWLEKHPESTLKEEEYKEYFKIALEFWNKLYGV